MLALLYPLDGEVPGYTREQFHEDLCHECEKDIRQCFAAGAKRVSMDFTEGRLACKNDPENPWTARSMLSQFIDLNNCAALTRRQPRSPIQQFVRALTPRPVCMANKFATHRRSSRDAPPRRRPSDDGKY
jgi:hypothetical protein